MKNKVFDIVTHQFNYAVASQQVGIINYGAIVTSFGGIILDCW